MVNVAFFPPIPASVPPDHFALKMKVRDENDNVVATAVYHRRPRSAAYPKTRFSEVGVSRG